MNMDYSKAFELLNQDTEKERNEKAKKAVHDNLYNKGFRDGLAVLGKIRAEISCNIIDDDTSGNTPARLRADWEAANKAHMIDIAILDKYKAESEDKENKDGNSDN